LRAMYGALQLHTAMTTARAGREGDAWRHWDIADDAARRLGSTTTRGRCSARPTSSCTRCRSRRTCRSPGRRTGAPSRSTPTRYPAASGADASASRSPALTTPAARLPRHPALAGDGLRHLVRQRAVQPDRPPDGGRHCGPRRAADQAQSAVAGREHRPAPVARGAHSAPLVSRSQSAHRAALRHRHDSHTHGSVRRETDGSANERGKRRRLPEA
jgi:hypothetical protein